MAKKIEGIRRQIREELIAADNVKRINTWMNGGFYQNDKDIKEDQEFLAKYYDFQSLEK